jgi:hypothetical protein
MFEEEIRKKKCANIQTIEIEKEKPNGKKPNFVQKT